MQEKIMKEIIIHVEWEGPFNLDNIKKKDGEEDCGVYQIYGNHPIYGETLIYIGKATKSTFAKRISEEEKTWLNEKDKDLWPIEIYIGRVDEEETGFEWENMTNMVEKLLIYAHQPACNSSNIGTIPEKDLQILHILNWGERRILLPEVSGARWTNRFADD